MKIFDLYNALWGVCVCVCVCGCYIYPDFSIAQKDIYKTGAVETLSSVFPSIYEIGLLANLSYTHRIIVRFFFYAAMYNI